ncbi:MAG: YggT family protein [Gammaproteobacteria bacterium]|nr:YggT family protein [Gammaproteobacteria bacterium]
MRALHYIIDALTSLYILLLLLRLVFPYINANFQNQLAQGIMRLTSPLVIPLRRVLPAIGRTDTATLLVAFVIQYAAVLLIVSLYGFPIHMWAVALTALLKLVVLFIHLFAFACLIRIILGWLAPGQYNPATEIIDSLTEPLLAPFRRLIPSVGGLDVSPIFVIIGLFALGIFIGDFRPYQV